MLVCIKITIPMIIIMDFVHRLEFLRLDVSETRSASVNRYKGGKFPTQLGPLERASLKHWTPKEVISRIYGRVHSAKMVWNV
jgi:hypothetical protein